MGAFQWVKTPQCRAVAWKIHYLLAGRLVVGGHAPKQLIQTLCGECLVLIHRPPVIVHLQGSLALSKLLAHVP